MFLLIPDHVSSCLTEEPTTGLDASCALMLGQVLAKLAEEHRGAGEPDPRLSTCAGHVHTVHTRHVRRSLINHMISPGFTKVPQDFRSFGPLVHLTDLFSLFIDFIVLHCRVGGF